MIKKSIIALTLIILVTVIWEFFWQNKSTNDSKNTVVENNIPIENVQSITPIIVPVENIAFRPYGYPWRIGIRGTVNRILDDRTFVLGCQDACVAVPVKYEGKIPEVGQDLIIYGKISDQSGKYTFIAESLRPATQYDK